MNSRINVLFSQIHDQQPSGELLGRIVARLAARQRRHRMLLAGTGATLGAFSALALAESLLVLFGQAASSGLGAYIAMALSDGAALLSVWREYALTVLEAIPVGGLMYTFFSLGMLSVSARLLAQSRKAAHIIH